MAQAVIAPDAQPDNRIENEMNEDTAQSTALAAPSNMALGSMGGERDMSDLKFPRLQIAYGVGSLSENFSNGDLVLDKEHCLASKKNSIKVIILNTLTYWKEYTEYGTGQMPRVFLKKSDVLAAGGSTDWGPNKEPPTFKKAMDMKLLIEKPEGIVCGLFGITLDGKQYAPATWSVDKTAYTRVNDKVAPVAQFALSQQGLLGGNWLLSTDTEKSKRGNIVVIPVIKFAGLNSPALIADIRRTFGGNPSEAA